MNRYKFIDNKEQHLHTLDMVPLLGTSTVLDIVAKQLSYWASGKAVECLGITDAKLLTKIKNNKATDDEKQELMTSLALKHQEIKNMETEGFFKLLDKAYRAHATNLKKTANKGKDLHFEIEKYVKHTMLNEEIFFDDQIKPFVEWSKQEVKRFLFSEIHTYSEKHWLGGVVDIGIELNSGEYGIIDIKSSDKAYNSQFWQIGGYDIQLTESGGFDKDGNLIFKLDRPITKHIVIPFRSDPVLPVIRDNVDRNKECFLSAMTLYKEENPFTQ